MRILYLNRISWSKSFEQHRTGVDVQPAVGFEIPSEFPVNKRVARRNCTCPSAASVHPHHVMRLAEQESARHVSRQCRSFTSSVPPRFAQFIAVQLRYTSNKNLTQTLARSYPLQYHPTTAQLPQDVVPGQSYPPDLPD